MSWSMTGFYIASAGAVDYFAARSGGGTGRSRCGSSSSAENVYGLVNLGKAL